MKYGDSLVVAFMEMNYAIMASFQHSLSLSLSFRLSKGESCAKLFRSGFYLFKTLGGNEAINDSRK